MYSELPGRAADTEREERPVEGTSIPSESADSRCLLGAAWYWKAAMAASKVKPKDSRQPDQTKLPVANCTPWLRVKGTVPADCWTMAPGDTKAQFGHSG